jgi:hypothetical protein
VNPSELRSVGSLSDRLAPKHAEQIRATLHGTLGYLYRLMHRMLHVGFTLDQPLYRLVTEAYDSLHSLCVRLHYMSCDGGTGPRSEQTAVRSGHDRADALGIKSIGLGVEFGDDENANRSLGCSSGEI